MPREKAQVATTTRPTVPMRRLGADCLVVVMKRGNACGAKGAGHRHWRGSTGNGKNPLINGRRQPSCDGTSRISREAYVRFCERLGVKFPGPTRHPYHYGRSVVSTSSHANATRVLAAISASDVSYGSPGEVRTCANRVCFAPNNGSQSKIVLVQGRAKTGREHIQQMLAHRVRESHRGTSWNIGRVTPAGCWLL
jgi:hypothetical protein